MSNTVILKRSAVPNSVPTTGQLTYGELAINYLDGNLFYKNSTDQIVVIASNQFLSVTGNVTGGNVVTIGVVSATGNVSGNYILGNGAFLTGLAAAYGNSNVANYLASGTDTSNIITTANVSGGNLLTSGLVSATGNIIAGNVSTAGSITATGNIVGANISITGSISVTGNVTAANFINSGNIISSGNVTTSNSIVYANTTGVSKIEQYYNPSSGSLDTVFL